MTQGIVTIACKHPLYGRYAYNLAVSVKAWNPTTSIAVIADEAGLSHLNSGQRTVFDQIISPEYDHYHRDGKCLPLLLKYRLPDYSPFERTLFLDADTILSPFANLTTVFNSFRDIEFTIANRGKQQPDKGISQWIDTTLQDAPYWYDISSEFIYFQRSIKATKVFSDALAHYNKGALMTRAFAGDKPDEPFLMLGMIDNDVHPHKVPFKPSYWYAAEKYANAMQVKRGYLLFSLGGKMIPKQQRLIYDELCRNAAHKSGLATLPVYNKMSLMPERQVI